MSKRKEQPPVEPAPLGKLNQLVLQTVDVFLAPSEKIFTIPAPACMGVGVTLLTIYVFAAYAPTMISPLGQASIVSLGIVGVIALVSGGLLAVLQEKWRHEWRNRSEAERFQLLQMLIDGMADEERSQLLRTLTGPLLDGRNQYDQANTNDRADG